MGRIGKVAGVVVASWLGFGVTGWASEAMRYPSGWVIESADYTGEVKDRIARIEARYRIRVVQDGWLEIPLQLPGATITAIKLDKKIGEAHIAPRPNGYVLAASKKGVYGVRVTCSAMLAQDNQFEGLQLGIPQATFSTLTLAVPRADVELRPMDQLYVDRELAGAGGVKLVARLGATSRVDLRWRIKPATPETIEPVIYGDVQSVVTLEQQLARVMSVIDYRVAQGEVKKLAVTVPASLNILNVRGVAIEDWKVIEAAGSKTVQVLLPTALKDTTYRLVIEAEETISASETEYRLPEVTLVGVKQERGYLAVAREGSLEITPKTTEGIMRVDVRELPEALQANASTSAILAFRYHQHPYQVALSLTRHDDHPVLSAIAEQGELMTVLARQGELLTRAAYVIKANKKQFVEVRLPNGASLWSCLVDGKSVKPVKGKEDALLIPLDAGGDSARAVAVEMVYFEQRPALTRFGQMKLQGPTLDVPTTVANWFVYTPQQVKFLKVSGNLERGVSLAEFSEAPMIRTAAIADAGSDERLHTALEAEGYRENGQKERNFLVRKVANVRGLKIDVSEEPQSKPAEGAGTAGGRLFSVDAMDYKNNAEDMFQEVARRMQDTGILPLKIRLPKSGAVHAFNRLMTAQGALELHVTYVNLPVAVLPLASVGLLLIGSVSGLAWIKFLRP